MASIIVSNLILTTSQTQKHGLWMFFGHPRGEHTESTYLTWQFSPFSYEIMHHWMVNAVYGGIDEGFPRYPLSQFCLKLFDFVAALHLPDLVKQKLPNSLKCWLVC